MKLTSLAPVRRSRTWIRNLKQRNHLSPSYCAPAAPKIPEKLGSRYSSPLERRWIAMFTVYTKAAQTCSMKLLCKLGNLLSISSYDRLVEINVLETCVLRPCCIMMRQTDRQWSLTLNHRRICDPHDLASRSAIVSYHEPPRICDTFGRWNL
jgi:hypothetical protein